MEKNNAKGKRGGIAFYAAAGILLLAGICLLAYPTVSDWVNRGHSSRAVAGYADAVEGAPGPDLAEMKAAAEDYNKELLTTPNRYFPGEEMHERYESLLDMTGDGMMAHVEIPKIGIDLPIYHGTGDAVLQVAAGHMEGSSLPIGGDSTHAVLSSHRGLPLARLFTDLDRMEIGDMFLIHVLDEDHEYRVDDIRTVLPYELQSLEIAEGEDYVTLVTCTPYGVNTHRLLIRGTRVRTVGEED